MVWLAVYEYAIAAGTLGRVADAIGGSQHPVNGAAGAVNGDHTDGDGEADAVVSAFESKGVDGLLYCLGNPCDVG